MPAFELDDIVEEVEKEFEPVDITIKGEQVAKLLPFLSLPKERRYKVYDAFGAVNANVDVESQDSDSMKAAEEDAIATIENLLTLVAMTEAQGRKLVKAANGRLLVLQGIVKRYMEATQPGEAEPSPS